jgi:hypothetical protein
LNFFTIFLTFFYCASQFRQQILWNKFYICCAYFTPYCTWSPNYSVLVFFSLTDILPALLHDLVWTENILTVSRVECVTPLYPPAAIISCSPVSVLVTKPHERPFRAVGRDSTSSHLPLKILQLITRKEDIEILRYLSV